MRNYGTCLIAGERFARLERRPKSNLAASKALASKRFYDMQSFEYPSVRYWSKEINGTLTGGRKN